MAGVPYLPTSPIDNIGIPRNPENPVYMDMDHGIDWVDPGLGGFLVTRAEYAQTPGDIELAMSGFRLVQW
jgi:hypothetical protein